MYLTLATSPQVNSICRWISFSSHPLNPETRFLGPFKESDVAYLQSKSPSGVGGRGACTYDIRKIFGFLDPLPLVRILLSLTV